MIYAIINSENIVQNLIEYDGVSEYYPGDGLSLSVPNPWVEIGDNIKKAKPVIVQNIVKVV